MWLVIVDEKKIVGFKHDEYEAYELAAMWREKLSEEYKVSVIPNQQLVKQ